MKLEIEIFRIICAFGIVWYHSWINVGHEIGYGGLFFFIIVSSYFTCISNGKYSILERAKRIMLPCYIWLVIYWLISSMTDSDLFNKEYSFFKLIFAANVSHLWFLPFIFFAQVAIDNSRMILTKKNSYIIIGICAAVIICGYPVFSYYINSYTFGQYVRATPAVLIGVFLFLFNNNKYWYLLMAGIVASIIVLAVIDQPVFGIPYLFGIAPCYFLIKRSICDKNNWFVQISSATFGIYLVHPIALRVVVQSNITGVWLPIIAFFLSLVFVLLVKRIIHADIQKYLGFC